MTEQSPGLAQPVDAALDAPRLDLDTPVGRLSVYWSVPSGLAAQTPPLLLIHSVNAAASAAEIAPLFRYFSAQRIVLALELPGFGYSDRSDRLYTPRLMTDAIHAALAAIAGRHGEVPVDVLAVSLASEFAARAAMEAPQRIGRLALVSPTGLSGRKVRKAPLGSTLYKAGVHAFLRRPLWSQALFELLTRPGVVRYFLRRTFGSQAIDESLWHACVQTARRPGARHAPLCFLSMAMFSTDIHTVYEALQCPVWLSMPTRGDFIDYKGLSLLKTRTRWQAVCVPGGALPYFEDCPGFVARLDRFLEGTPAAPASPAA